MYYIEANSVKCKINLERTTLALGLARNAPQGLKQGEGGLFETQIVESLALASYLPMARAHGAPPGSDRPPGAGLCRRH
jgi:hypothetical protein